MAAGGEDARACIQREIANERFDHVAKMGVQYTKKRVLGEGTFGQACQCRDLRNGCDVVVKICKTALRTEREEKAARREVAFMKRLDHPNVVRFMEAWVEPAAGSKGGMLHIAMEFCSSGDLADVYERARKNSDTVAFQAAVAQEVMQHLRDSKLLVGGPDSGLTVGTRGSTTKVYRETKSSNHRQLHAELSGVVTSAQEAIVAKGTRPKSFKAEDLESWLTQILLGLYHIHKKGRLMHRDIKPCNVFLTGNCKVVKIGDFGLSGLNAVTNAQCRTQCGTPWTMAPEVWKEQPYTDRCDVFSVGCMFYSFVTFTMPYNGQLPYCRESRKVAKPGEWELLWGEFARSDQMHHLACQISDSRIRAPAVPPALCEPALAAIIMAMLSKDPQQRPTVGQILRGMRLQHVAHGVREALGIGDREGLLASDDRHCAYTNPMDTWDVVGPTYKPRHPDAEIYVCTAVRDRDVGVYKEPNPGRARNGWLNYGQIIEIAEHRMVEEQTTGGVPYSMRWFGFHVAGSIAWCRSANSEGPCFMDYGAFCRMHTDDSDDEHDSSDSPSGGGPTSAKGGSAVSAASPRADADCIQRELAAAQKLCKAPPRPTQTPGRMTPPRQPGRSPQRAPRSPQQAPRSPKQAPRSPKQAPRSPAPPRSPGGAARRSPTPARGRSPPGNARRSPSPTPAARGQAPQPARSPPPRARSPAAGGAPVQQKRAPAAPRTAGNRPGHRDPNAGAPKAKPTAALG